MKKANELKVGDKLKAGEMVAEVESIRTEWEGAMGQGREIKYIQISGQPEIADWNLQKFIDQGSIEII